MALRAGVFVANYLGAYQNYERLVKRRIEAAALIATERAANEAKNRIRSAFRQAGLGNLGNAIGSTSDKARGGVHRRGDGFSASGIVHLRTKSERTIGAIISYTKGASIMPRRGRWLWIPTDEIQRLVGTGAKRRRLEPRFWEQYGLDRKIGPLVLIKSVDGRPLLVVKNATVALSGQKGKARARTKTGKVPRGQAAKSFIVCFIAIPATSRAARVDVRAIFREVQMQLPQMFVTALRGTRRG